MENKDLFQKAQNGYNCDQVEQYINALKAEYKKVVEIAKATDATNKKLKKICQSLSEENKALKASGAAVAPVVQEETPADENSDTIASIEKIAALCEEIAKENAALFSKISK